MKSMSFLDDAAKVTGNQYATRGQTVNDERVFYDTGSYILNALLSGSIYGGFPANGGTALAGSEGVGKTYFALSSIRSFLDSDPDASVIYFETEGAINRDMCESRGIDFDRVLVVPVATIEDYRTQAMSILNKYEEMKADERPKVMFILDSLGMLSTKKEVTDISEGKDTRDMTRAQLIRGTFRAITLKMSLLQIPNIITNHTYKVVGSMFPVDEVSGGGGLKYSASTILMLSKKKEKDGTEVSGNIIHCKTYKSRSSRENRQVDVRLFYESGLDRYYGLIELGEKYGVFEKIGTRILWPDGRKEYAKTILKNPEKFFTDDIMKKLDECAQKEFQYGSLKDEDAEIEDTDETEIGEENDG